MKSLNLINEAISFRVRLQVLTCLLLTLLIVNTLYPQDTLAIDPAVILEVNNIMYIENNVMISTSYPNHQNISVYDFTNPQEPELIDNAYAMSLTEGGPEFSNKEQITGATMIEDMVIWCTMKVTGVNVHSIRHGPIELLGRRIGEDEPLWRIELMEQSDERYNWPGNMVRYEEFLIVAGGESGIQFFDLTEPANPEHVNTLEIDEGFVFTTRVINIGERLLIYSLGMNEHVFRLYDISDPTEPELLGTFDRIYDNIYYDYRVENVTHNGCVLLRNRSLDENSTILALDITSDNAPRVAAIIDLERTLDGYEFFIDNDKLFVLAYEFSVIDVYSINAQFEIEHIATMSPSEWTAGQFLAHDNKLIFSSYYPVAFMDPFAETYIYEIPPVSVPSLPSVIPASYSISAYPNPFNATTTINYSIPQTSIVSLGMYDITGRLADNLISEKVATGNHVIVWDASDYPTGIYFCRMQAGSFVETRKLVLMK